jgi:L-ascorbate metabolism protein UlaG (beta-lactamase superfamily)
MKARHYAAMAFCALLCLAASPELAQESPAPAAVTLKYLGHACFQLTAADGTVVVADPYGPSRPAGLAKLPDDIAAAAVTISHYHPDHSGGVIKIKGGRKILDRPGSYAAGPFAITGYESDHGRVNGLSSGPNTVFVFQVGGVKIAHLGAAGLITQGPVLDAIKGADLAMIDVAEDGGHPIARMFEQLAKLGVRAIVPVHFTILAERPYYGSPTLDQALAKAPKELKVTREGSEIEVMAGMPEGILCMSPSRLEP